MDKLKVLFLQATPNFGGDVVIHELLIRFCDQSHIEPHVACLPELDGQESRFLKQVRAIPGVQLRPTQFAPNVYLRSGAALSTGTLRALGPVAGSLVGLVKYVRRQGIDVVHSLDRVRDAVAAVLVSRLGGARLVMHMHAKMGEWVSPLAKLAMRNADALIGVSDFVIQSAATLGLSPNKMHCVHNGIDLSRWDLSLDGGSVREELRIPRELPVFVYSGRFNTWKGPHDLVRAAARLKQMGHDFRVLMVGDEDASAPAANRVTIASLRELASELRVLDNVMFTGFRPDLPRVFAAADAYAMPTFEEPFANVFLEALAMRKPVLGLYSGGVPEAVEHGRSGLLSRPHDIEQFAANMARLIREPQLRLAMGEYGRTRVEEEFQASRMTRETERVYRHVLHQAAA
ncbi:MAG TPA: glycosyltransferase family 4 protein [Polyangiales bacterium]|nr:glycosyltransferase family 4 protein [Polyangiales bacterium]